MKADIRITLCNERIFWQLFKKVAMTKEDFAGMEFNPFATFGDTFMCKHYKRLGKIKSVKHIKPSRVKNMWQKDYDLPVNNPKVVSANKRRVSVGEW